MGFYEDDHWFAARTLTFSLHDLAITCWGQIYYLSKNQGRPIGLMLGDLIPYVCYHIAGVSAMFVAGWMIFSLNAVLVYTLLRRCLVAPLPMIGAIAFIVFPADTTRPFLCHAHILQPSITFMLLACHLHLSNRLSRRWAAYLFAIFSLLTYETALLPFLVFPLLQLKWERRWLRQFAIHLLVLAAIGGSFFLIRRWAGEVRVVDADTSRQMLLEKIWTGTGIGLNTLLTVSQKRAEQGSDDFSFRRENRSVLHVVAVGIGLLIMASSLIRSEKQRRGYRWMLATSACRAGLFAAAGLGISYLFCFTHYPPFYEEGRLTSTHLAATLPLSILMAVCGVLPIICLPRIMGPMATALLCAIYFTCLFSSARDEQIGYVDIWHARQHLWTRIIDLCPDMTDSTLIAFEGSVAQPAYYMGTSSWSDFLVLGQIYDFSASHFHRDPMAANFRTGRNGNPTWKNNIVADANGHFIWNQSPFGIGANQPLFDYNLILLHTDPQGNVTRQFGTVKIAGRDFHLKEPEKTSTHPPAFPTLPMYCIMTGRPG